MRTRISWQGQSIALLAFVREPSFRDFAGCFCLAIFLVDWHKNVQKKPSFMKDVAMKYTLNHHFSPQIGAFFDQTCEMTGRSPTSWLDVERTLF